MITDRVKPREENRLKVFGYTRVSSLGQCDGDGLTRQRQAITDYAESHEMEVVFIYQEEGVSGTVEHRPALAEMMLSLEINGHGITTIIIEKIDRLARDLMIQEAIINDFQKKKFKLISVYEGDDMLSNDPTRKLVRQVLGSIAEYEKKMIVLKLKLARDRIKALTGHCEGRKGYKELNQSALLMAKFLRDSGKTYATIAEELNDSGHKAASGGKFTARRVQDMLRAEIRRKAA